MRRTVVVLAVVAGALVPAGTAQAATLSNFVGTCSSPSAQWAFYAAPFLAAAKTPFSSSWQVQAIGISCTGTMDGQPVVGAYGSLALVGGSPTTLACRKPGAGNGTSTIWIAGHPRPETVRGLLQFDGARKASFIGASHLGTVKSKFTFPAPLPANCLRSAFIYGNGASVSVTAG